MTVRELIDALRKRPQDALVVLSGRDHSYREVRSVSTVAIVEEEVGGGLSESSGDADEETLPGVLLT